MTALALSAAAVSALALGVGIRDFLSGQTLLRDLAYDLRLLRDDLAALDAAWAARADRSEVLVSLTTIPSRIGLIDLTLKSLLRQTRAPARIRLNVPRVSRREGPCVVPPHLRDLRSLEIAVVEDQGPATKLLTALASEPPERAIVVVDDDMVQPPSLVRDLEAASIATPGAAVGLAGWRVPDDLVDRPTTFLSNVLSRPPAPLLARRLARPAEVDVLMGTQGYLVRPRFFDLARLADHDGAPPVAWLADDVWFAAHCLVPRLVVPARRAAHQSLWRGRRYARSSLGLVNRGPGGDEGRTNTIMIRHFADRWLCRRGARA